MGYFNFSTQSGIARHNEEQRVGYHNGIGVQLADCDPGIPGPVTRSVVLHYAAESITRTGKTNDAMKGQSFSLPLHK